MAAKTAGPSRNRSADRVAAYAMERDGTVGKNAMTWAASSKVGTPLSALPYETCARTIILL